MCDIRYILEENVSRCHQKLQAMGTRVDSVLQGHMDFIKDFDDPIQRGERVIKTTIAEVECWISGDFAEPMRSTQHMNGGAAKEDIEPFYYLRRNPILCGLMIFRFSLTLNELGLGITNAWGSTIAVAHLYNAIRHELPEFPRWLDMDALILIHSSQRIFWRDQLRKSHWRSNSFLFIACYRDLDYTLLFSHTT